MFSFLKSNRVLVLLLLLAPLFDFSAHRLDDYFFRIVMLIGINIILAVSLNLVNGITGQFSLGHAGFMAVGAYASASITYYFGKAYLPAADAAAWTNAAHLGLFLTALLSGGLLAGLLGFIVGVPSLRLRGDYLAIITLGFGEIIRVIILNIDAIGGARGFPDIPPYTNFYWVYIPVVITVVVLNRLVESSHGRAFLAVREDEIAAEAVGVSTTRYKVLAFVISSFFAGIAGGLFAHYQMYINPSSFTFMKSFEIITMVVLGGMGSLSGSMVAATGLTILPEALRSLQDYTHVDVRMVIYSLLLIVLMLTRPNGLFGKREIWNFRSKKP